MPPVAGLARSGVSGFSTKTGTAAEQRLRDLCVRDRGRGDDRAVDLRQLLDRRDDAAAPPSSARPRLAAERATTWTPQPRARRSRRMCRPQRPQPTSAIDFSILIPVNNGSHPLPVHDGAKARFARQGAPRAVPSVVDEIVLAADRSGDPATLEVCADLADKRFAIDPAPLNRRVGLAPRTVRLRLDPPVRRRRGPEPQAPRDAARPDRAPRADAVRDAAALALRIDGAWISSGRGRPITSSASSETPLAPGVSPRTCTIRSRSWAPSASWTCRSTTLSSCSRARRAPREAGRVRGASAGLPNGQFPMNGYYTPEDFGE